jgi:4-amino-4-deoxy-L-arabinose transferase-like glycosyltransferase
MMRNKLILILILLLSLFLRTWGLNKVPPELFGDELDVGYHAYSILKTGRDYYGQLLPSYIHSFSEWRAPLMMYVTAPFVGVFGLNEWGVRLPSAFFGVVTVYLLYLLVKKTLEDERLALISSFLLAISPWHLQYSRAAFEASLLLALILGGTLSFIKSFEKPKLIYFSAVFFSLTFYTYSTANAFTPLFIAVLVLVYWNELKKTNKLLIIKSIGLFSVLIIPILYQLIFGFAAERYSNFSVFNDEEITTEINMKRQAESSPLAGILLHNKPIYWGKRIVANYTSAFSPRFLFVSGDVTFRHSVHDVGEFYWFTLPFLLIGAYSLVKSDDKKKYLWLLWLIIAPIPSSLTKDGSIHATRLILMLPPMIVVAAYGFDYFLRMNIKESLRRLLLGLTAVIVLFELVFYQHDYWVHYPKESWRWWHTGYKEAMNFMESRSSDYDIIVFNNTYEPSLIRFLFWWKYPPSKFMTKFTGDRGSEDVLPGFNGFSLGNKYYFGTAGNFEDVLAFIRPGMLYLVSQRDEVGGDWDWEKNPPGGVKVLKTVRNPYGEPIFYVLTGVKSD